MLILTPKFRGLCLQGKPEDLAAALPTLVELGDAGQLDGHVDVVRRRLLAGVVVLLGLVIAPTAQAAVSACAGPGQPCVVGGQPIPCGCPEGTSNYFTSLCSQNC